MSRPGTDTTDHVDVVGARVAIGVQMIGISRLSTHPVPLVPGCLITVAGQGPKDSNGAGKSSFIAGLTLLHGDEQWRLASGASQAVDLLFSAEIAAQEHYYASADHGYVVGVFADPAATDLAELTATALTVWLQIRRTATPHVLVRWADGLHLPMAATEADREQQADQLWDALPPRAGRRDYTARDLSRVLFGGHVRCVSFLSTSVRPSATANLLAQPLNELKPDRIFAAVTALTGLDHELLQEQRARNTEHTGKETVESTRRELQAWQDHVHHLEQGIDRRDRARDTEEEARQLWRTRTACLVAQAAQDLIDVEAELEGLTERETDTTNQLRACDDELRVLGSDTDFQARYQKAERNLNELSARDEGFQRTEWQLTQDIEKLRQQAAADDEAAREADGRDEPTAQRELVAAHKAHKEAIGAHAIAEKAHQDALEKLAATETGDDVAAEQLALLRQAGLRAVALLDAVTIDEEQRPFWEPALWPYREAAVVRAADVPAALAVLDPLPGSLLVPATERGLPEPGEGRSPASTDPHRTPEAANLPRSAEPDLDLTAFLTALRADTTPGATPTAVTQRRTGVVVVGGFPDPVTGRAARIAQARTAVQDAAARAQTTKDDLAHTESQVRSATRRLAGAQAARAAERHRDTIKHKRAELDQATEKRGELAPRLNAAKEEYEAVRFAQRNKRNHIETLRKERQRLENTRTAVRGERHTLQARKHAIDLDRLLRDWGGTVQAAEDHLAQLPDEEQLHTEEDWWRRAENALRQMLTLCFPTGEADEAMPTEIRGLLEERTAPGRGQTDRQKTTFPTLFHAVCGYLRLKAPDDAHQRDQIQTQRTQRRSALAAAELGYAEAAKAASANRSSLGKAISAQLKKVSKTFDELDRAYGGYGASLRFTEPEAPTDPSHRWTWEVTPVWRRAEGKPPVSYDRRGNTALMDEKAVKLVCAAAMASGTERPLLLVLDELGRNLGKQHRREAVALFERIGADNQITIVGALQDDMERYALDACGQYIKLRRTSDTLAYNQAPVILGFDRNTARVRLLQRWLTGHHNGATATATASDSSTDSDSDPGATGDADPSDSGEAR